MREKTVKEELAELLDQADREGLWLFTSYQQMWFSHADLRAQNDAGRFLWGPANWQLRDPAELIAQKEQALEVVQRDLDETRIRVQRARQKVGA